MQAGADGCTLDAMRPLLWKAVVLSHITANASARGTRAVVCREGRGMSLDACPRRVQGFGAVAGIKNSVAVIGSRTS